ncbi:hypothetical protein FS837_000455, partial [Tulasnella sp. UAMH 9824]
MSSSVQATDPITLTASTQGIPRSGPPPSIALSRSLVDLPPDVISQILLALETRHILYVRQASAITCKHLFEQTKSQKLWERIAQQSLRNKEVIWPSWGLPLHAIPAETIEELVVRTKRLADAQRRAAALDHQEIRIPLQGLILRPRDSPMWMHLIRGRWLLLQLRDFTLELWDLDDKSYARPAATCSCLKGFVDGITVTESSANPEITISTTSFTVYKFAPDLPFKSDPRLPKPTLTAVNSFEGYSLLKAKTGRLLAFAASSESNLRTCIVDELTRREVELSSDPSITKIQKTLDVMIQDGIIFVARPGHLELYTTSDMEQALSRGNLTKRSIRPFQSLRVTNISFVYHPRFHANLPSYFQAPRGSVLLTHFIDHTWHAFVLQPQPHLAHDASPNYRLVFDDSLGSSAEAIYGISIGEAGYRCATVGCDRLAINYAKRGEANTDGCRTL